MRRRYIAFKVLSESRLSPREVYSAILESMARLFGARGLSEANLRLVSFDPSKGVGILRCSHRAVWMVRASLALISHVSSSRVSMHAVRVSGTIRALREKVRLGVQPCTSRT